MMISKDHPRVCGEQSVLRGGDIAIEGSPPRVRGTGSHMMQRWGDVRITPACAGNREIGKWVKRAHEDYPRVCGEQCPFFSFIMH